MRQKLLALLLLGVVVVSSVSVSFASPIDVNVPPTRAFAKLYAGSNHVTAKNYLGQLNITAGAGIGLSLSNGTTAPSLTITNTGSSGGGTTLDTMQNLGGGTNIYFGNNTNTNFQFNTLAATGASSLSTNSNLVTIYTHTYQNNTGTSLGTHGTDIYTGMVGTVLQFPKLLSGNSNCVLSGNSTNDIITCSSGSGIITSQNVGKATGSVGALATPTPTNIKGRNFTGTSPISVTKTNDTDAAISCPTCLTTLPATHFLVQALDTERVWTNIGTSFVDATIATANANGHAIQIDTNGFTKYRYQIIWTKAAGDGGTETCQLVDIASGTNIMTTTASLVSGMNTGSDTAIPAGLLNTIKNYKWQCKSTTSTDDPSFLGGRLWLVP